MKKKEFSNLLMASICHAIEMDGDKNLGMEFCLNLSGGLITRDFPVVVDHIFRSESACPRDIDIGLTRKNGINQIYIVVSGHEYVDIASYSKFPFKLPINFMGREI